jgi:2-polyprenyl-3-methyl-5-hydroxy-6-metoxy-1,4-benzoquinol methylase
MNHYSCRICNQPLTETFVDLGFSPLANHFINESQLQLPETHYPLHVYFCSTCYLVQLPNLIPPESIFTTYAYFSSYSDSWLAHCKDYTELMIERFGLDQTKRVVEIASNDGYLLQYFAQQHIPVLGIEPARNVAKIAEEKGIPTVSEFFGIETAQQLLQTRSSADLLIGNNVFAHVPDLHDFVEGCSLLLSSKGILTAEFPHLLQLIQNNQFDTIYHEHYSYFSFHTISRLFKSHGLSVFDVDEITTHGGSLRVYAQHANQTVHSSSEKIQDMIRKEERALLHQPDTYKQFQQSVNECKYALLSFLLEAKNDGKTVAAYGAAAKGNTLLNYCGIQADLISFVVDRSPHKQGKYLPGSHIPIVDEEQLQRDKPDYVIILPWNIKKEIFEQLEYIRSWGGLFVIPIPTLSIIN